MSFNPHPLMKKIKKKVHYFNLPYYGHLSFIIRIKIDQLFTTHFPNLKIKLVFTNSYTIIYFFPFKDRISTTLQSNIVYGFKCSVCKHRYVGETSRNLTLRFAEHKGVSPRTGREISSPSHSMIREHSVTHKHPSLSKISKYLTGQTLQ